MKIPSVFSIPALVAIIAVSPDALFGVVLIASAALLSGAYFRTSAVEGVLALEPIAKMRMRSRERRGQSQSAGAAPSCRRTHERRRPSHSGSPSKRVGAGNSRQISRGRV